MSDQYQSSSPLPVYENAAISSNVNFPTDQGDLLDNLFPSPRSFVGIGVDSFIELLGVCRRRPNENVEAMKVLYHQRQSMMAESHVENSASPSVQNGSAFLPFTELGFCKSKIDAFQYHGSDSFGMDIRHQADTLDAAGPLAYRSMEVAVQQQASAALSCNSQTSMTDTEEDFLPCLEATGYRDQTTASFSPEYPPFPQSASFDYGHAQKIAFSSASSCLPGHTMSPVAVTDTNDNKDDHATSSVAAPPRDGPTVLSFISGGIKHYRCECGYESTRKRDIHHHIESLRHSKRKYKCSCSKKFTRYDSLGRHMKRCKKSMGLEA